MAVKNQKAVGANRRSLTAVDHLALYDDGRLPDNVKELRLGVLSSFLDETCNGALDEDLLISVRIP